MELEIEGYDAALTEQQRAASDFVESSLRAFVAENPGATTAVLRDYGIQVLSQAFRDFGGAAERMACDAYDATARALGVDAEQAEPHGDPDGGGEDPERIARYQVGKAAEGDVEKYIAGLAAAAFSRVRLAASRTTAHNAERKGDFGKGMRFARVPTGRETCGFCLVLASRGFVYSSRNEAGGAFNRFHRNCDCRVVAGTDGCTVPGYDPEWYRQVYADAVDTCGSTRLSDVCREIETRAPQWVYRREPGVVSKEPGAKPLEKEMGAAKVLAEHGIDVTFIKETNKNGIKTPDAHFGDGTIWEFKIPENYTEKTVKNQFKNALGKGTTRLLIGCDSCNTDSESVANDVRRLFESGDFPDITEVLIEKSGQKLIRIKRET